MSKHSICPTISPCLDGPEFVSAEIHSETVNGFQGRVTLDQKRPMRFCYWLEPDGEKFYTSGELSSNYVSHNQFVPSSGSPSLNSSSDYLLVAQTFIDRDENGDPIWYDVSCPIEAKTAELVVSSENQAPLSLDTFWNEKGYQREWSSTPSEADAIAQQPLSEYFLKDHATNGYPNQIDYIGPVGHINTCVLSPDGVPSLEMVIPSGEDDGATFRGNQFGPNGLEGKRCIVYSHRVWTPPVSDGGLSHPDPGETSGIYLFSGHHQWSVADSNASSSGGTYRDDSATFRYTINGNGEYHTWAYIAQHKASGSGRSFWTGKNWKTEVANFQDERVTLDLEVVRNSAGGVFDGELRMYVNHEMIGEYTGLNIAESSDQWAKGFGIYNTNPRMEQDQQIIHASDMIIYSKNID